MNIVLKEIIIRILKKYVLKFLISEGLKWLKGTEFFKWLVIKVLPKLRLSNKYTQIDSEDYRVAYDRLMPGDLILSIDHRKSVASKLVGGDYSHIAFCIGKDPTGKLPEVADMVAKGYREIGFYDLAKESDEIAILRCEDFDPEYIEKMIKKFRSFKGKPYDHKFKLETNLEALYCSEAVYEADIEKRAKVSIEDKEALGFEHISPNGYYNGSNISRIFISKKIK